MADTTSADAGTANATPTAPEAPATPAPSGGPSAATGGQPYPVQTAIPGTEAAPNWQKLYEAQQASAQDAAKRLATAEKKAADAAAKLQSPDFLKAEIGKLLGLEKEVDPKAEFAALQNQHVAMQTKARTLVLKSAVAEALEEAEVLPKMRGRLARTIDVTSVNVDLATDTVDMDAIKAEVAKLKEDTPEFFKAPAPDPSTQPATPAQPQGQPLPSIARSIVPGQPQTPPRVPSMTPEQMMKAPISEVRAWRAARRVQH